MRYLRAFANHSVENEGMRLVCALSMLVAAVCSFGQIPKDNPVVDRAITLGKVGLTGETGSGVSPLKFKPSGGRIYIDEFVKEFADDKDGRDGLKAVIEAGVQEFEAAAKENKMENDGAFAHAFSLLLLETILTGKEFEDQDYLTVAGQFRKAFTGVKGTDKQKQEFYEWSLSSAFIVIAVGSALEGDDAAAKLKQFAELEVVALTGATQDQISFSGGKLLIKGTGVGEVSPAPAGLVEGFSYGMPDGWVEEGGWIKRVEPYYTTDQIGAHIRMLPAVKANGDIGATLRDLWSKNLPEEFKGKSSGMVFRRYLGDGLAAHFIFGQAKIEGEQGDSLYSLYIVDCGSYWQPFVLAQTWADTVNKFPVGAIFSAPGSFGKSADIAEVFFAGIKCPSAKGRALVDKAAIVGDYSYGSSSSLQWENIYTGASSMTFVSYGGTLNFAANGTFTYTFSSASGVVGAAKFSGAKGNGTWKLEGDLLTCHWTAYDQGDSYKPKDYVYRVAGVISYSDGVKVLVLKQNLDLPINAVTVRDASDYYTTKKK